MSFMNRIEDLARRASENKPGLRRRLVDLDARKEMMRHALAPKFPGLIKPRLKQMTVAITAQCNLRCVGCRYGRDYMPGHQLSLETVERLLEDGRQAGAEIVRLYGGEPLLHKDLPAMVRKSVDLGYRSYVTTNGMLLADRIAGLYDAGLRDISLGFYGVDEAYNEYVQKENRFERLCEGLEAVRSHCGSDFRLQLNFLIMRPTANIEHLRRAWQIAEEFDMTFHTDLIHYSLPYFRQGADHELQFLPEHRPAVEELVEELVRLKKAHPDRVPEPLMSLRSIPDWLFKGAEMKIPCDAYRMVWIGADGTVRLCYVCFDLGNLHDKPLSEMLFDETHKKAAQEAFQLKCPNCHCERITRIGKHGPSRKLYGK